MARSVFSKVAWVGRTASMVFGLALVLALVFGVATTALGANGKPFLLGKANVATLVSTLVKQGPGPALSLKVGAGQPPLAVNSAGKVANLNADRVDGLSSEQFANGVGGKATDADKLDNLDSADFQRTNAAAGGDLSGTYPNPQIAADAVGSGEVENYSLHIIDITKSASYAGVDPGVVPAAGCINQSIAGAYAAQGDFVFLNPPHSLPSGLVASPLLANAGPVTFRLCNMTSSDIDPPQGSWGLAVFNAN